MRTILVKEGSEEQVQQLLNDHRNSFTIFSPQKENAITSLKGITHHRIPVCGSWMATKKINIPFADPKVVHIARKMKQSFKNNRVLEFKLILKSIPILYFKME